MLFERSSRAFLPLCVSLVVRRHPRARAVVPIRCIHVANGRGTREAARRGTRDTSTKLHTLRPVDSRARGGATLAQFYPVRREVFAHSLVQTQHTRTPTPTS